MPHIGKTVHQTLEIDLVWAIAFLFFLFFLFWQQSGWYRLDCSLGVERACELIAAEKDYQAPAARQWESK